MSPDPLAGPQDGLLAAAGLPRRWAGAAAHVVLDLAFGDGLAFLATRRAWRDDARRPARLHYAALLEAPLGADLLDARLRAHRVPPEAIDALRREWPPATPGVHRVHLEEGRLVLHLAVGPARRMLPRWMPRADTVLVPGGARGAPFHDPAVLRSAAGMLASDGRLALAPVDDARGPVLSALRGAGLALAPRPDAAGAWAGERVHGSSRAGGAPIAGDVLVVGAGLAGRATAVALARRGRRVLRVGGGPRPGSLQPVLAQHPSTTPDDAPLSRLTRAALLAWRGAAWRADAPPPCGRLQTMDAARAHAAAGTLPADWVRAVDAREASALAGVGLRGGGLWLPAAGTADPLRLADAWRHPSIDATDASPGATLSYDLGQWRLHDASGRTLAAAPIAVLATGAASIVLRLAPRAPALDAHACFGDAGLHARTDRTTLATLPLASMPRCIVGGDGHAAPADATTLLLGPAPWTHGAPHEGDSADDARSLHAWHRHAARLVSPPDPPALRPGPTGTRLSTRDHLPLVGRMPAPDRAEPLPGLWTASAFGGRGLLWAVLAAEAIGAALDAEPAPLEHALLDAIDPARFARRHDRRR